MAQDTITNQNNQDWQNRFDILSRQRQEESTVRMQHNAYLEHNRMKSANLKADLDALRKNGMNVGLMYGGSGGYIILSSFWCYCIFFFSCITIETAWYKWCQHR